MSTAREQFAAIARDGAAQFSATDLAHNYAGVTRRVRRDRGVRAGVTTLAGVGVVGAGTFGVLQLRGADATVLPATPSPSVTESVSPSPSPQASDESLHRGTRVTHRRRDREPCARAPRISRRSDERGHCGFARRSRRRPRRLATGPLEPWLGRPG
nr:hypothetical protein [Demequina litorisediminis]